MIATTYEPTEEEAMIVASYLALPPAEQSADLWGAAAFVSLRKNLKEYYFAIQEQKCCYCDEKQPTVHQRAWDLEHIVPRSTHPQFLFVLENLAMVCIDCNISKSDLVPLKNKSRKTYPSASADFTIIHPHYDNYSDHIEKREYVYLPRSDKGRFTIYACNLLRYAQKALGVPTVLSDRRYEDEVEVILGGGADAMQAAYRLAGLMPRILGDAGYEVRIVKID